MKDHLTVPLPVCVPRVHTREIARLLERRKMESAEAARQQNEALSALRSRMEAQLKKRNSELQAMSMKVGIVCDGLCVAPHPPLTCLPLRGRRSQCTELQALADRCARDRQTAEREVERVMAAASKEHEALNAQVQEVVDRMKQVESERDSVVVSLREAQAEAAEAERRWAAKQRASQEEGDAARRVRALTVALQSPTQTRQTLEAHTRCIVRQAHEELLHELDDAKLQLRQTKSTIKDLTSQLQEADAKMQKVGLPCGCLGGPRVRCVMRLSMRCSFRNVGALRPGWRHSSRRSGRCRLKRTCVVGQVHSHTTRARAP